MEPFVEFLHKDISASQEINSTHYAGPFAQLFLLAFLADLDRRNIPLSPLLLMLLFCQEKKDKNDNLQKVEFLENSL
jgi:hypothetical protein